MNIDLTQLLLKSYENKRVVGRYSVSDLFGMLNGYLPPEKYLENRTIQVEEALRMKMGEAKHYIVRPLLEALGFEAEVKKEYPVDDFVLVGKVDAMKDDLIIEIKTSDKLLREPKKWHEFQLKCYLTIFEKPRGIIGQPVINNGTFYIKVLKEYKRDDKWFLEKVIEPLKEYHRILKGQISKEELGQRAG